MVGPGEGETHGWNIVAGFLREFRVGCVSGVGWITVTVVLFSIDLLLLSVELFSPI